jgi:hypothetical protein
MERRGSVSGVNAASHERAARSWSGLAVEVVEEVVVVLLAVLLVVLPLLLLLLLLYLHPHPDSHGRSGARAER